MQLPATLTLAQASKAAAALADAARQARPAEGLAVDAGALQEFDTSALAVLLEAGRAARTHGLALKVLGAPPKLCQLAALYGVDGLLGLDGRQDREAGEAPSLQAPAA